MHALQFMEAAEEPVFEEGTLVSTLASHVELPVLESSIRDKRLANIKLKHDR